MRIAATKCVPTHFLGPTIAEIPSLIMLLLPTHVTGYISLCPMYAASSCTTCAEYPNAVATLSSVTSLCAGNDSGGAGSVAVAGIGSGTSRTVKRRSGGETSSIGYMNETMEMRLLRMMGNRLRRDDNRILKTFIVRLSNG